MSQKCQFRASPLSCASEALQSLPAAPRMSAPVFSVILGRTVSRSATFRMRRADVRELLQDVGVGLEAGGRTLVFCQESDAVIDDVVSEDPAIGILCGLRRIEAQH